MKDQKQVIEIIKENDSSSEKNYSKKIVQAVLLVFIMIGLYFTSVYEFLLFHFLVELFSIAISWTIFMVAWNSREFSSEGFFLFMGISFLFIGFIDLIHTLAYEGIGLDIFHGYDANLPTQLWVLARYVQSIAFFIAIGLINKKVKIKTTFFTYGILTTGALVLIFLQIFPTCYVGGLTPFKKISEYVIDGIFLGTFIYIILKRKYFEKTMLTYIVSAIIIMMGSELLFTFYISVVGLSNLLGHYLKFIAFYFIYLALIQKNLHEPYYLIFRDLKENEQNLLIQKRNLDQLFNISIPMCIIDPVGNIIQVNDTFCRYFQLNREEILCMKCYEIRKGSKCHTVNCTIEQLQRGKSEIEYEWFYEKPNGQKIDYIISAHPYYGPQGEFLGVIQNFTDITERKRVEYSLRQSEEKYRRMFEDSPVALKEEDLSAIKIYLDKLRVEGVIDFNSYFDTNPNEVRKLAALVRANNVNKAYMEIYHAYDEKVFYHGLENIFTEESYQAFQAELVALAEKKTFFEIEAITQKLNGQKNNIYMRLSVVPGYEDSLSKVLVSIIDNTEQLAFDNLRQQFIYTVSHELRTPISVIIQAISNLQKYQMKLTKEQYIKLMDTLSRNASVLASQVEDLLLVSRLQIENIQLKWISYNLSEVIMDVITQFEPRLESKSISINRDYASTIDLLGDPLRIAQICRIIIDNAIKYSKENSKIVIEIIDHYKGTYNPSVIDGVLVKFIDEGIGIQEKDISNLFERFFRSEDVVGISGTGLGLSIAHTLTQLHHGEIYVESKYGKGSTFCVFFPRFQEIPQNKENE
ncbi:MAG: sensor histidine kinase [Candidatus Helarchaeota archaeon]